MGEGLLLNKIVSAVRNVSSAVLNFIVALPGIILTRIGILSIQPTIAIIDTMKTIANRIRSIL